MPFRVTFNGKKRPTEEWLKELEADRWATRWEGGTVVNGEDLTEDTLDEIAFANPKAGWSGLGLLDNPNASFAVRYALIKACADLVGIEPPSRTGRAGDARKFVEMVEMTQPIDEEPMENGIPKEEGQNSPSSSTSPGNTTGPEPSPENSPSAGC